MKFFSSFFESAASKQSPSHKRDAAAARQEAINQEAIAEAYRRCGPRVARHLARSIKKSKEEHTCVDRVELV